MPDTCDCQVLSGPAYITCPEAGTIFVKEVGFRSLVNAHAKEITANPWISGIIDLELGELSLARAGVKARIVV